MGFLDKEAIRGWNIRASYERKPIGIENFWVIGNEINKTYVAGEINNIDFFIPVEKKQLHFGIQRNVLHPFATPSCPQVWNSQITSKIKYVVRKERFHTCMPKVPKQSNQRSIGEMQSPDKPGPKKPQHNWLQNCQEAIKAYLHCRSILQRKKGIGQM